MPDENTGDIAVIGAGAAGLMAAIQAAAAAPDLRVLLLDSRKKIGAKILISGGTRCNVTNVRVRPTDYNRGPGHFVKHVLEAFTPQETIAFFERIGVELIAEPTGKYFPVTHSGKTVLEALMRESERAGVKLWTEVTIERLLREGEWFVPQGQSAAAPFAARVRRVILATGGLSLPETGSDGTGLRIAQELGHTVVMTSPALTPLTTPDPDWKELSGITLEAGLSVYRKGKKEHECQGSFLFTHFGYSGPSALDISRHWVRIDPAEEPEVFADFAPQETVETLNSKFEAYRKDSPKRTAKSFLEKILGLPERFAVTFLKKANFEPELPLSRFTRADRGILIHSLMHCPLDVDGVVGYKKAEVTAGGVELKEVKVSTMESKLVPGLYFTGEVLDIDGRIGGFNFQWAWSSGTVAGRAAAKALA